MKTRSSISKIGIVFDLQRANVDFDPYQRLNLVHIWLILKSELETSF